MVKRRTIGLIFDVDDHWTGGIYYILNIISALKCLPKNEMPQLIVFYRKESSLAKIKSLGYPNLRFLPIRRKPSVLWRICSRFLRIFTQKPLAPPAYNKNLAEFVYPCVSKNLPSLRRIRKVYWIADFQHYYYPDFFSSAELSQRNSTFSWIAEQEDKLVLSSEAARRDFQEFFPGHKNDLTVISFATVLPKFVHVGIKDLREKFSIDTPYFISPNQFWVHKNHLVVIKAAQQLRAKGLVFKVVFTGNEVDYRCPGYSDGLKSYVLDNGLSEYVSFLGFIDRAEQLQLMNNALAVIQPSLFEGWSTVVEDAKAIDQAIIASDLPVHREQCAESAKYFHPHDDLLLADLMEEKLREGNQRATYYYQDFIVQFARKVNSL